MGWYLSILVCYFMAHEHSWLDSNKKVHYVYAKTLDDLCEKEAQIAKDKGDGIKSEARYTTVKDLFDL